MTQDFKERLARLEAKQARQDAIAAPSGNDPSAGRMSTGPFQGRSLLFKVLAGVAGVLLLPTIAVVTMVILFIEREPMSDIKAQVDSQPARTAAIAQPTENSSFGESGLAVKLATGVDTSVEAEDSLRDLPTGDLMLEQMNEAEARNGTEPRP
ncbi:hypothetical protein [Marivita sp. S2033]|uniref:hypothetical protein n=1 Tax=Marivita sp. S2033 TaxID=3373187 RepID=UPI003981FDC7